MPPRREGGREETERGRKIQVAGRRLTKSVEKKKGGEQRRKNVEKMRSVNDIKRENNKE